MEALLEAYDVTSNGRLFGRHLGFYHELENFFFLGGGGGLSHTNETYLCTRRLKLKRRRRSITWRFSVMLRCSQQHKSPSIYLFFSILCVIFFNRLKLVRSDGRGNYRLKVNSNRHRKGHQAPQKYES